MLPLLLNGPVVTVGGGTRADRGRHVPVPPPVCRLPSPAIRSGPVSGLDVTSTCHRFGTPCDPGTDPGVRRDGPRSSKGRTLPHYHVPRGPDLCDGSIRSVSDPRGESLYGPPCVLGRLGEQGPPVRLGRCFMFRFEAWWVVRVERNTCLGPWSRLRVS